MILNDYFIIEVEFEQDYENTNEILPDESASNVRSDSSSCNSGFAARIGPKLSSTVWNFFDKNTVKNPGFPVCQNCKATFESKTSTSSLRCHLDSHQIVAPKRQ
ncbi:647_t:CDS:2 [Funneliformis geosporum]|nr:647_t:CDS:2 [Funneliformis geosporum]